MKILQNYPKKQSKIKSNIKFVLSPKYHYDILILDILRSIKTDSHF